MVGLEADGELGLQELSLAVELSLVVLSPSQVEVGLPVVKVWSNLVSHNS